LWVEGPLVDDVDERGAPRFGHLPGTHAGRHRGGRMLAASAPVISQRAHRRIRPRVISTTCQMSERARPRREVFNEINRDEVVADLLAWLGQRIGVRGR
jgi:hypothetical protein